MTSQKTQMFEVDKSFNRLTRVSAWILLLMTIASLAIPLVAKYDPASPNGIYLLTGIVFLALSGVCIALFRIVRKIPFCSVSIDDDGLWYTHLCKRDGLVPWGSIEDVRERSVGQRLLIISRGVTAMKIEYQLSDFRQLRATIADRAMINLNKYQSGEYSKKTVYHVFYIASLIGFGLLGYSVGKTEPVLGYSAMLILVFGIAFEYLRSPYGIRLREKEWIIQYPLKERKIQVFEITDIRLTDIVVQGNKQSEVHLVVKSSPKPIRLKGLGVDSIKLYRILIREKSKRRQSA